MPIVPIQLTNVYYRNENSKAKIPINVGGAGSSKSYSIAQVLLLRCLKVKNYKVAICRKTFPSLRLTAYKLFIDLLREYKIYERVHHDKQNNIITFPDTGAYVAFLSIDDPEKIKSTEWNAIWLEEANEFTWDDWIIIQTRLRAAQLGLYRNQIYLSLNPSDEQSWINQKLMVDPKLAAQIEIIHSTFLDNPFLGKDYVELLLGLKDQDLNAYMVYAEGKWGVLTNIIYQPYTIVPELRECSEIIYGIDFGFNNPTAVIRIGIHDIEHCYLDEKLYQTHLTNGQLIDQLKIIIPEDERLVPIYADCAEPNRIEEIHNAGFNVMESNKDVETGIDFCKRKKFYATANSVNLIKERAAYKWRQDKNGNVLDEPVKFMDHLMDAKRYAIWTYQKDMVPWEHFMK